MFISVSESGALTVSLLPASRRPVDRPHHRRLRRAGGRWRAVLCRRCARRHRSGRPVAAGVPSLSALAHPHEFALGYGSPVPGYAAPADTVGPATRVPRLLARVLRAAAAVDVLMPPRQPVPKVPLVTAQVLAIAGPAPPQPFADLIERSLVLW